MKTLQNVGKAFMVPVALIPIASLLFGIGFAMQYSLIEYLPFLESNMWQLIASVMAESGGVILNNLPLIFAVGVAMGLTEDKGIVGLSALIGFLSMNVSIGIFMPEGLSEQLYANVLGISTLQTSIFGGIVIALVTKMIYERYHTKTLPKSLAFFEGTRFVLIMTAFIALIVGLLLAFIWPPIGSIISQWSFALAQDGTNPLNLWLYGSLERLTMPFGLNEALNYPFFMTEVGGVYSSIDGVSSVGELAVWQAQLADYQSYGYQAVIDHIQAQGTTLAGRFSQGEYPIVMFGLPAAAIAIYRESTIKNRKWVGGFLLLATVATLLTGITEPLELIFMFVAPILYVIHAILTGLSYMVMYMLNVHVGTYATGGLVEFLTFGILPGNEFTNWIRVIFIGILYVPIYYFVFRFTIRRFNLLTLGREVVTKVAQPILTTEEAKSLVAALGGSKNIEFVEACMSRLRVSVQDIDEVDQLKIKSLGASGIFISGHNIQAIFGAQTESLKLQVEQLVNSNDETNA